MTMSVWPEATWVGGTESSKLTAHCCFLLLRCYNKPLLEAFSVLEVFSGSGSRMGFVLGCEGNPMEVVVWPMMAWID